MCAEIMVLGTFHFHEEGVQYLNIQSDQRQREITETVDRLSRFMPNKIAVECLPENEIAFNEKYKKFLSDGIIDPGNLYGTGVGHTAEACNNRDVDERVMIGFQVGKICNANYLHAVDYMNEWLQENAFEYAKIHQPTLATDIESKANDFLLSQLQQLNRPMNEILYHLNMPETMRRQHRDMFMIYNKVGTSSNYTGSGFVSSWYERNLKIVSNIQRIAEAGDRVLVIIGMAHGALINQFISECPAMSLVSPLDYL